VKTIGVFDITADAELGTLCTNTNKIPPVRERFVKQRENMSWLDWREKQPQSEWEVKAPVSEAVPEFHDYPRDETFGDETNQKELWHHLSLPHHMKDGRPPRLPPTFVPDESNSYPATTYLEAADNFTKSQDALLRKSRNPKPVRVIPNPPLHPERYPDPQGHPNKCCNGHTAPARRGYIPPGPPPPPEPLVRHEEYDNVERWEEAKGVQAKMNLDRRDAMRRLEDLHNGLVWRYDPISHNAPLHNGDESSWCGGVPTNVLLAAAQGL